MKRGYEGSITIYLALVFSVLLSLIFTVVEEARRQAQMLSLECGMDLALYSVFAEYNRELLEQYDLFFIDTGYGINSYGIENTRGHLEQYLKDNLEVSTSDSGVVASDFLQMQVKQVQILEYTKASDEKGDVFKRQAIAYMKNKYGLSYFENLQKSLSDVWDEELLTKDITAERNANEAAIDAIELPKKKISEDEYEEMEIDNPADAVHATRNVGVLALVVEDVNTLSQTGINKEQYISNREISEGSGLLEREAPSASLDLLYHEYILEKCSFYTKPLEKSVLKYQAEYILAGKDNDIDNLKWVVNRLLLLRETANVAYLFSDAAKVAQAQTLALSLSAVIAVPELCELIKISILFAWAYAESVHDVKTLLAGGGVPLIKTSATWHFSLEGMLNYQNGLEDKSANTGVSMKKDMELEESKQEKPEGNGLRYKDYLRILLFTVSDEDSIFRMMDVVEMDIRKTAGNASFRLDACVDYLKADVIADSRFGTVLQIQRKYYYL